MSAIVQYFEQCLSLPFFTIGMKTDLFRPVATADFFKFADILSAALYSIIFSDLKELNRNSITSTCFVHHDAS